MALCFLGCGLFMIIVGNYCPDKYNMKDISSQGMLKAGLSNLAEASKTGAVLAFENREGLLEMGEKVHKKINKDEALL